MAITNTTNSPYSAHVHKGVGRKIIGAMKSLNPFKTCMSAKHRDIALEVATKTPTERTLTKTQTQQSVAVLLKNPSPVNTFLAEVGQSPEATDTPARIRRAASVYSQNGQTDKISPQNYYDRATEWLKNANNANASNDERIQAFTYAKDSAKYAVAMGCKDGVDLLCNLYRSGIEVLVDPEPQQVSFWNSVKTKLQAPLNPASDFVPGSINSLTPRDVKVTKLIHMSGSLNDRCTAYPIEDAQKFYGHLNQVLDPSKTKGGDIPDSLSNDAWTKYQLARQTL